MNIKEAFELFISTSEKPEGMTAAQWYITKARFRGEKKGGVSVKLMEEILTNNGFQKIKEEQWDRA